jgi:hypothetical protein
MKVLAWLVALALMAAGVWWVASRRDQAKDLSERAGQAGRQAKEAGEQAGRKAKAVGERAVDGAESLGEQAVDGARSVGVKAAEGARTLGRRTGEAAEVVGQKVKQKAGDLGDSSKCTVAQGHVRRCLPLLLEGRSETAISARCRAAFVSGDEELKQGVLCLHQSNGDCAAVTKCLALPVWGRVLKR